MIGVADRLFTRSSADARREIILAGICSCIAAIPNHWLMTPVEERGSLRQHINEGARSAPPEHSERVSRDETSAVSAASGVVFWARREQAEEEMMARSHGTMGVSRRRFLGGAAGAGAGALLAGRFASVGAQSTPSAEFEDTVRIGIVTSRSGPLQSYGEQYLAGLEIGLKYATGGTGVINGHKIEFDIKDDTGVPDVAVNAAKELIGEGVMILAGSVVSGVALQVAPVAEQNGVLFISGPAATDGMTGINPYTFRSGRQTYQDILTAAAFLDDLSGKTVLVYGQDTAFGQANVAAVTAVFGEKGATVDSLLVAQDARDFAPFSQQIVDKAPDLLFVAWAGTTATAMWTGLDSQGVLDAAPVVTGLDIRASYPIFGPAAEKISFLSHYVYQAPSNEANDFLIAEAEAAGTLPDLFHPDGFSAAQMIVRAVGEAGGEDVDGMITALEGWTYTGVKGEQTIRAEDHAHLQPMFHVKLVAAGDSYEPEVLRTLAPDEVAPPVVES
jgi:branched-chain amino acid transport system substrate-binding protein